MESIRNFLKSWPGRIFLILCLSPLALFGIEGFFGGNTNPNQVAQVGDLSINTAEYQNALNNRRSELLTRTDPSLINESVLKEQVLDGLIDSALLQQQAQKLGMSISDATINDMLLEEPSFQDENGKFSNERFAFFLQQRGMNKLQLFDDLRKQLSLMQLNTSILKTAVYPMKSIDELIALQEESRHIWLHRYPWQDYIDRITVSDEDITAYYNEHKNDLKSKAMVDLSYIVLSPDSVEIEPVTDAEVQTQYDAFKRQNDKIESRQVSQILLTGEDAQTKIIELKQRLDKGESFAALAKEFSEDEGSRENGGDIGTFNPDIFADDAIAVEQALKDLAVGDVSEPIKTAYGYQLFTVTKNEGKDLPTIDDIREQLTADALRYKREALIADKTTAINDMAVDGVSIEDISQQEGLAVKRIADYTKEGNQSILNQPAVIEAAFDEFAIQDQAVSTNIEVNDLTVWVQPSNYRPIAPLSIEAATPQIKAILVEQKASELASKKAQEVADSISASGMDSVDIEFQDLGDVTRQTSLLVEQEKTAAFSQASSSQQRQAIAQETKLGASVLVMDPISKKSQQTMPENIRVQTAALIRDNRGQEQLEDYLHYLRATTEVVKNDSVLNSINGS